MDKIFHTSGALCNPCQYRININMCPVCTKFSNLDLIAAPRLSSISDHIISKTTCRICKMKCFPLLFIDQFAQLYRDHTSSTDNIYNLLFCPRSSFLIHPVKITHKIILKINIQILCFMDLYPFYHFMQIDLR